MCLTHAGVNYMHGYREQRLHHAILYMFGPPTCWMMSEETQAKAAASNLGNALVAHEPT